MSCMAVRHDRDVAQCHDCSCSPGRQLYMPKAMQPDNRRKHGLQSNMCDEPWAQPFPPIKFCPS